MRERIKLTDDDWWLRSPSRNSAYDAKVVSSFNGDVFPFDCTGNFGVRPVLLLDPESVNLKIGDKVKAFKYTWTAITESKLLCDSIIGKSPFRSERYIDGANDYRESSIKKYLEDWLQYRRFM